MADQYNGISHQIYWSMNILEVWWMNISESLLFVQPIGSWEINFNPKYKFQTHYYLRHDLINCFQVIVTKPHKSGVTIGSGNCLVPSGNKPFPEPMLTQIHISTWYHLASVCWICGIPHTEWKQQLAGDVWYDITNGQFSHCHCHWNDAKKPQFDFNLMEVGKLWIMLCLI